MKEYLLGLKRDSNDIEDIFYINKEDNYLDFYDNEIAEDFDNNICTYNI